jgi:hypothetical protein
MPDAMMQLSLYNVETEERTMLVGLTRAQLVRFKVVPGSDSDLKAYLDEAGHLAVWECRPTPDARVELVQPLLLYAGAVVACDAAPLPPMPLAA